MTPVQLVAVVCATPRVGATALLESLRAVVPGAREYPDAVASDGVYLTMAHWAQMPVGLPDAPARRFVYVSRADRVAQAISWAVAGTTGRFHSTQPPSGRPALFDRAAVARALVTIEADDRSWRDWLAGRDVLEVVYERDLRPGYRAGANRVLAWLGLPERALEPTLRPVETDLKAAWRAAWGRSSAHGVDQGESSA